MSVRYPVQDSTSFAGYEQSLKSEAEKAVSKVKGGAKKATQKVIPYVSIASEEPA